MKVINITATVWGEEKKTQITKRLEQRKSVGQVLVFTNFTNTHPGYQSGISNLEIQAMSAGDRPLTNEDLGELLNLTLGDDSCFISITGVQISH